MKTNKKQSERQFVAMAVTGREKVSGREIVKVLHVGEPGAIYGNVYFQALEKLGEPARFEVFMVTLSACKRFHRKAWEEYLDIQFCEATGGRDRRKSHSN